MVNAVSWAVLLKGKGNFDDISMARSSRDNTWIAVSCIHARACVYTLTIAVSM